MTSIRLEWLSSTYFQLLEKLQVQSLQVLEIQIRNEPQDKVPAFDILQEFLPRHPNITQFEISFWNDYVESKSCELIPMILETLPMLERLMWILKLLNPVLTCRCNISHGHNINTQKSTLGNGGALRRHFRPHRLRPMVGRGRETKLWHIWRTVQTCDHERWRIGFANPCWQTIRHLLRFHPLP